MNQVAFLILNGARVSESRDEKQKERQTIINIPYWERDMKRATEKYQSKANEEKSIKRENRRGKIEAENVMERERERERERESEREREVNKSE